MKNYFEKYPHLSVECDLIDPSVLDIQFGTLEGDDISMPLTRKEAKALRRLIKDSLEFTKPEKP